MLQCAVYPNNPTDLLVSAHGTTLGTPTTIFNHAANEAVNQTCEYWCQGNSNFDGTNPSEVALCFYGVFGKPKLFVFTDSQGNNQYTVNAVECQYGRPPVIRQPH